MTLTVNYLFTGTGVAVTLKGRVANQTAGAFAIYAQEHTMTIQDVGGT